MDEERKKLLEAFKERPDALVSFVDNDNEERRNFLEASRAHTEVECEREKDINLMRRRWSNWLLLCIVLIVIFDLCFTLLLGYGGLSYSNENIIFVFIAESLAKIGGLAYIVVNFLFDREINKKK
jgi:hypothetical protein